MDEAQSDWHEFASRGELAAALGRKVASLLGDAIAERGEARLAVSGGTTPRLFFHALSREKLDWSKVTVTLVDERAVPPDSPRSNQGLVTETLLRNEAAAAKFIGLYTPGDLPGAARRASDAISKALPLDMAVLGMGTDGHTASFFPDADNLEELLDPNSPAKVLAVNAPSGVEPRLTLALARIVEAGFVALHIEGQEKRTVLESALGQAARLPVRAVFDHAPAPVQVFWAP
ncbi:6-phosphogluconolactonase [Pseudaminobacter sp. NGMCC 1.201702]|uniref:6-phosphogluconolactonase n=1 Tax=Pseudaminobacter sp. NGMCC 1.201702 TaxID=3391825 RepID=UPI0039EFF2BA